VVDPLLTVDDAIAASFGAYGSAVNDKGIAVGFVKDAPAAGPSAPFLFNAKGKITPLPVLLGSGRAFAINDNGYVTGLAGSFVSSRARYQVFLYNGRTISGIGPVSEIGAPRTSATASMSVMKWSVSSLGTLSTTTGSA
jgi:hypothetical protein